MFDHQNSPLSRSGAASPLRQSRWLTFLCLCLGLIDIIPAPPAQAQDNWSIKRRDRRPIIIGRLKAMLRRKPFSNYAFRKLIGYHRGQSAMRRLIASYQQRLKKTPNDNAARAVLARLQHYQKRYTAALPLYREIQRRRPAWRDAALGELQCLLALKQRQAALQRLRTLLPQVKRGRQRRALLQKMLVVALKSKDTDALQFVRQVITKESWKRADKLKLARDFSRYGKYKDSIAWFTQVLNKSRGSQRFQLLLELIQVDIEHKRYAEGRLHLKQARALKSTHTWMRWELLQKEIALARYEGTLPRLTQRLTAQWKNTKSYEKMVLLARLYREQKRLPEATLFFERAVKLRPSSREAHLYLYKRYSKLGQMQRAQAQLKKMIKYKIANPDQYLLFARAQIQSSRHPGLDRWSPNWPKYYSRYRRQRVRYRYRYRYRYRGHSSHRYRYRYLRRNNKSSRATWEAHRKKTWAQWQRYASAQQKRQFNEGIRLLKQLLRRYASAWDTLYEAEKLCVRHGQEAYAKRIRRQLYKTISGDLARLKSTETLLNQLSMQQKLRPMIKRALRSRSVTIRQAGGLAEFAFNWALRQSRSKTTNNKVLRRRRGRRVKATPKNESFPDAKARRKGYFCPDIRRMLSPLYSRLTEDFSKQRPFDAIQIYAMGQLCGQSLPEAPQRNLEALLMRKPKDTKRLVRLYAQTHNLQGFQRIFPQLVQGKDPIVWIKTIQKELPFLFYGQSQQVLFRLFQKMFARRPKALQKLVEQLCQHRRSCMGVDVLLEAWVAHALPPFGPLIKALESTAHHHLFVNQRNQWVNALLQRFPSHAGLAYHLAKSSLFYYHRNYTRYYRYRKLPARYRRLYRRRYLNQFRSYNIRWGNNLLAKTHQKVLLRALKSHLLPPAKPEEWALRIKQHLYRYRYQQKAEFFAFRAQLEAHVRQFPNVYRSVIQFYLTQLRFKKYGQQALKRWLQQHRSLNELQLLSQSFHRLGDTNKQREAFLIRMLDHFKLPEHFSWFEMFAKTRKLKKLERIALEKRFQARPNNRLLLQRLISLYMHQKLMDTPAADRAWQTWLRQRPDRLTYAHLKQVADRGLFNPGMAWYAAKLLQHQQIQRKEALSKLWPLYIKICAYLSKKRCGQLLTPLAKHPTLKTSQAEAIAQFAKIQGLPKVALQFYFRALQSPQPPKHLYQYVAKLADEQGNYREGEKYWKRYLSWKQVRDQATFFRNQAELSGVPSLAMLYHYRSYQAQQPAPESSHAQVLALQRQNKPHQAWALWLFRQGKKAEACLQAPRASQLSPPPYITKLRKLGLPVDGPVVFFPLCHWNLELTTVQQQGLAKLARQLNSRNKSALVLHGFADTLREPDALFLAKQRVKFLHRKLKSLGAVAPQIKLRHTSVHDPCNKKSFTETEREQCLAYTRQVMLGSAFQPWATYTTRDADRDGVPDHRDTCPLTSRYPNLYYTKNPHRWTQVRYLRGTYKKNFESGCRRYNRYNNLTFRVVKPGVLKFQNYTFRFYKHSHGHVSSSYLNNAFTQLSSLMKLMPSWGKVRIEMSMIRNTYGSYYRYHRYRRGSRGFTSPQALALRRLNSLKSSLQRFGVASARIQTQLILRIKTVRSSYEMPEVVISFPKITGIPLRQSSQGGSITRIGSGIKAARYYLGCYKDSSVRDLRVYTGQSLLVPSQCILACRSRGYPYAGIQYYGRCFCGRRYGRYGRRPESECRARCRVDRSQYCGAYWRNRVYKTK